MRLIKRQRESAMSLGLGSDGFRHPHQQSRREIRGERGGALLRLNADAMCSFRRHRPVQPLRDSKR